MKTPKYNNWNKREGQTARALGRLLDIQFAQNRKVTDNEVARIGKLCGADMRRLRESAEFINRQFLPVR